MYIYAHLGEPTHIIVPLPGFDDVDSLFAPIEASFEE